MKQPTIRTRALALADPLVHAAPDARAQSFPPFSNSTNGGGDSSTIPEASGVELIRTAGVRDHSNEKWSGYFAHSYDNSIAVGIRIGAM